MTDPHDLLTRITQGRTDLALDLLGGAISEAQAALGMIWVAHHGDVAALRRFVEAGHGLDRLGEDHGLRAAAFHGHWQLCQYLLEAGTAVDQADPDSGETALHLATSRANRPQYDHVIRVLLRHGADPNRPTIPARPTGAFMRDVRTKGESSLHRAAAYASLPALALLLAAGGDRSQRDAHGDTPLSWASWHLRPAAVIRVLCYGDHHINPENDSTYDHGVGWGQMDLPRMQRPY